VQFKIVEEDRLYTVVFYDEYGTKCQHQLYKPMRPADVRLLLRMVKGSQALSVSETSTLGRVLGRLYRMK